MDCTSGDNETFVCTREENIVFPSERVDASTEAPPPYEQTITGTSLDNNDTFTYPVSSNPVSSSSARPPQTSPLTSETSSENAYIWYFWDIENIPLAKRYSSIEIHNIVDAIRSLCGDCFPGAKINHMNFRVVTASENVVPRNIKDALVKKTVEFHDRPGNGQPERADKDILRLMFDTVLDHFEKKNMAFVLITGDGGYMDFLESLKKKGVIPILIHKDNASEEIKNCAKYLVHWNQVLTRAKISLKETDAPAPEIKQSHTPLNVPSSQPLEDTGNMKNNKKTNDQVHKLSMPSNGPSVQNFDVSNTNGKKEINGQTAQINAPSNGPSVQKSKNKPYIILPSLSFSVTEDMLMRCFPKAINCEFTTENNIRTAYIRFNHEKEAIEWWGKSPVIEGFKLNIMKEEKSFDISKLIERPAVNTPTIDLSKENKPYITIISLSFSVTKDMLMRWFPKAISCEFITEKTMRTAYIRFNHENDAMEWWGKSPIFEGFKLRIKRVDKSFNVGKPVEPAFFTVNLSNERSQKAYGVSEAIFQYMKKHIEQIEKIKMEGQGNLILYQPTNVSKFVFEGPSTEIFKAADKIKKLIYSLQEVRVSRKHPLNSFAVTLLSNFHLQKLEHEWDVSLSIIPSKEDSALDYKPYDVVIVGPKNEPGVQQTTTIVQSLNLLNSVVIKLDLDQLRLLETSPDKGLSQLDIIADKNSVTYNIVEWSYGHEIVLYAFAVANLSSAKEAIEQTIVTKRFVSFKKGILAHAIKFHAAEIDTIRLRNNSVTILFPWLIPLKEWQLKQIAEALNGLATISLSGPPNKVTNVTASFKKLMDGISLVSEIFKYPYPKRLQARRRFEDIKKTIEEEENVSILLQFKENTNMDTDNGNLDTSYNCDKNAKDKGGPVSSEITNTAVKQFGSLMIAVTAVGNLSTVKDALAKFDGIHFDTKYIITAEELNKNGRQLQPLIKALDPPKNAKSILRDYLHKEINVGFHLIPRAYPNRIELFGENEEVLRIAKEKIFNFLSGVSDLTGSEKVNIAEPLYGSWIKRYEWKNLHDIAISNTTSLKTVRTEDRHIEFSVIGDKRNTGKARYELEKRIIEISTTLANTPWIIENRYAKIPLESKTNIEGKYQVDIQVPDLPELLQRLVLYTDQIIELVEGNITEQAVDAIVNAANSDLKHEGGIAKAIADAAGPELIADTAEYLRDHRSAVSQGQAIFTKPGFLAKHGVKIVVHAVGPRWYGGHQNEDQFLFSAVRNALLVANQRGCKTIAIPPISTGIFGYPKDKAAAVLLDAVVQTLPQTTLDKVRIVDMPTGSGVDDNRSILTLLDEDLEKYRKREITSRQKIQNSFIPLPTLAQTTFQWSWEETRGGQNWTEGEPFVQYDSDQNMQIEKAFNDWKKNGSRDDADPISIIGDVGGVKNNAVYEVLFFQSGVHLQRKKNTGFQRKIRRIEISAPSTSSASENNKKKKTEKEAVKAIKESDRNYKHWKELVKFNIVGRTADVSAAVSDLKRLVDVSIVTHEISKDRLKSLWQEIAQVDLKGSVTSIASRFFVDAEIDLKQKTITLIGCKDAVKDAELEIREWTIRRHEELKTAYPDDWETFSDDQKWYLASVKTRSLEWNRIVDRIKLTMPNVRVSKIERVQNRPLYDTFLHYKTQVADKNGGNANVLSLFHGTRNAKPNLIYASEQGFDPTFSSQGLWGKGCYFAYNASYSHTYTHTRSDGTFQLFLAEVIVGSTVSLLPQTLSRPPQKPQTSKVTFKGETYDSVKGFTGGSDVYIVYYSGRFYPSYLITYTIDDVVSPAVTSQAYTIPQPQVPKSAPQVVYQQTSIHQVPKATPQVSTYQYQQTSIPQVPKAAPQVPKAAPQVPKAAPQVPKAAPQVSTYQYYQQTSIPQVPAHQKAKAGYNSSSTPPPPITPRKSFLSFFF